MRRIPWESITGLYYGRFCPRAIWLAGLRVVPGCSLRGEYGHLQGQAASLPPFDPIEQDTDICDVIPQQHTGRSGGAISFATIHQARPGEIYRCSFGMKLKQRHGGRSGEVTCQPFSRAANVDKLERPALAQIAAYILRPI